MIGERERETKREKKIKSVTVLNIIHIHAFRMLTIPIIYTYFIIHIVIL